MNCTILLTRPAAFWLRASPMVRPGSVSACTIETGCPRKLCPATRLPHPANLRIGRGILQSDKRNFECVGRSRLVCALPEAHALRALRAKIREISGVGGKHGGRNECAEYWELRSP